MTTALVVCIGNRLVGDDGAGPAVYDVLEKETLPEDVGLELLETRGIALLDDLSAQERLLVVDAVQLGTPPGTLHILNQDTLRDAARMPVTSHDIALTETLAVCAVLYPERMPKEVLFIGIQGRDFNLLGGPLCDEVAQAIPEVVSIILKTLRGQG